MDYSYLKENTERVRERIRQAAVPPDVILTKSCCWRQ